MSVCVVHALKQSIIVIKNAQFVEQVRKMFNVIYVYIEIYDITPFKLV